MPQNQSFKCYFDASYWRHISGCAFCVLSGDETVCTHVHHEKMQTPDGAEMRALYLLLRYIEKNVEKGSAVEVYGDANNVIMRVKRNRKRRDRSKIKLLYNALLQDYDLTLHHIPRIQNKVAHKLARTPYVPEVKIPNLRYYDPIGTTTIPLEDITIPYSMMHTTPNPLKYQSRLLYYQQHGREYRTIQVDTNGMLIDGYITYLILKEHGVTSCCVEVKAKRASLVTA